MKQHSFVRHRWWVVIVSLMVFTTGSSVALARTSTTVATAGDLYADVIPSLAQQVRIETDGRLPIYRITGQFIPASAQPARIEGTLRLSYVAFTDLEQTDLFLRLYPNFVDYGGGMMSIGNITIDGVAVEAQIGNDPSLATIPLPKPLQPGETAELILDFVTTIPNDPVSSYGMFGYFSDTASYNLAQWMPLLAGWDPATGWMLDSPNTVGDPVFSNAAMFDIELTAASDITFVTTGTEISREDDGLQTIHRWVAGPSRDFVISAGTDLAMVEQQVGETTIRSWYFHGYENMANTVLQYGVDAFTVYSENFGTYPYTEMDLVQTRLGDQAAGIEFPGLMYVGANHYVPWSDYLEFTVVHEVAHQWWYGIVGNNQYLHAFIDEALANESSMIYKEAVDGSEAAQNWIMNFLTRPYVTSLFGQIGDQVVDRPTADFGTNTPYGRIVYSKGALGFDAIRQAIGDDTFFQGLRDYVSAHRFGIAQPEDLLQALENASGQDLQELWSHWFKRTEGMQDFDPDDLMVLIG